MQQYKSSYHKSEQPLVGKGLLFSYDEKDKQYLMFANKPKITDSIKHSWRIGQILNQGTSSQCVGYSWSQFLQTQPWTYEPSPQLAPAEIYRLAQQADEWPGQEPDHYGSSVRAGAKILKELGLISSYVWGYSVEDVATFISQNGPVVAGTKWFSGMSNPDQNGFSRPISSYEGGHAWIIYGVDCQWETFFCANSWGPGFGKNGRFLVKFKDMEKLINEGRQICSALK